MVEAIANSMEDKLIDSLQFKLKEGASYITDRRSVTFYPQGSNIYKPKSGTKVIKIMLNGNNWLDPSTFRVMFDLRNNDGEVLHELRPIGSPWAFFRRARLICGGQTVEDIDFYNRTHEMMHTLTSTASRQNDFCEAFGNELTILEDYTTSPNLNTADLFHGIPGTQSITVLFKPILGLLNQNKFLPLSKMGSMTLELELVDDVNEPIIMPDKTVSTDAAIALTRFSIANTSNDWQIENVQIKVDLITLDNGLQNTYDTHLLNGNAYPINYNTFITQSQNVIGGSIVVGTGIDAKTVPVGQQKIS